MCSTPLARPVGECKCTCESADQLSVNGWAEASLNPVHLFWNICSFTLKIRKSLDYLFGIKNEQTNKKNKNENQTSFWGRSPVMYAAVFQHYF